MQSLHLASKYRRGTLNGGHSFASLEKKSKDQTQNIIDLCQIGWTCFLFPFKCVFLKQAVRTFSLTTWFMVREQKTKKPKPTNQTPPAPALPAPGSSESRGPGLSYYQPPRGWWGPESGDVSFWACFPVQTTVLCQYRNCARSHRDRAAPGCLPPQHTTLTAGSSKSALCSKRHHSNQLPS